MPPAVYALGLAIFAQGTSELMLAGLLPEISADLGVSIPAAGLLISAFAIGMLVGAPILAVTTTRFSRRAVLLTLLALFVLTHVVAGLTSSYGVLLATRVAGAFVYAGFWAAAAAAAVGLAGPERTGRALSVVAGGLTVASIIGLPAGAALAQHLGWRSAFWAVAVLSTLASIAVAATIPGGRPAEVPSVRAELRSMRNPRLWLAYGTISLSTSGLLASFSYLAPLITESTGLAARWIPIVLGLYGVGALAGITVAGRIADRRPYGTLVVTIGGVVVISALIGAMTGYPAVVVPAIALLGAFGFGANPALNTRVFGLATAAPTLAAAFAVSAFNVGITVGPYLGGLAIDAGAGYPAVAWIGAVLAIAALGSVALAYRLDRQPAEEQPREAVQAGCGQAVS